MEIRAGTSCDENRRDLKLFIQVTHAADKRCDRLFAVGHDALHQFIAYHESSWRTYPRRSERGSCRIRFLRLHWQPVRCFRWHPRSRMRSYHSFREIVDEEGDIDIADAAGVLGAELYSACIGDDIFPAVSGDVVVYTAFKRLQQGGLSVKAATDNQSNAKWNAHAGNQVRDWEDPA